MNNEMRNEAARDLATSDARLAAREEQTAHCNREINREWTDRSEGWMDRVAEYQRILGY